MLSELEHCVGAGVFLSRGIYVELVISRGHHEGLKSPDAGNFLVPGESSILRSLKPIGFSALSQG